jgi:hypothetical protein
MSQFLQLASNSPLAAAVIVFIVIEALWLLSKPLRR